MNDLRQIDLNLLVVLDALLRERHVTRAAEHLGMSQPAVSHALTRLRQTLGDDLLVRTPGGLRPTARASEIEKSLHEALTHVRRIVREPPFEPREARRVFRLAMSDYGAFIVLPGLLKRLRREAPGVALDVVQLSRDGVMGQIASDQLDLALGVFQKLPMDVRGATLFEERWVCLADRANSLIRHELSIEEYLALPHALVSVRGETANELEAVLFQLRISRMVAIVLPHFMVAPKIIEGTDLVLTLPYRMTSALTLPGSLAVFDAPFQLAEFVFHQIWHTRNDRDPGHVWLRRMILDVAGAGS